MSEELVFVGSILLWWLHRKSTRTPPPPSGLPPGPPGLLGAPPGPRRAAVAAADDDCSSLFYGHTIPVTGEGLPYVSSQITNHEIHNLTKIKNESIRISSPLYQQMVWSLPIVCVDVILQRKSDHSLLLFWRRDKPAANIWWWPGGRMMKGETFYSAACRKIREETGNLSLALTPVTVLKVWNTFFSDSNWDTENEKGCQTVNIIVICVVDDCCETTSSEESSQQGGRNLFLKESSKEWAVEAHRWVSVKEALTPGKYDKYVRLNVEEAVARGFLQEG